MLEEICEIGLDKIENRSGQISDKESISDSFSPSVSSIPQNTTRSLSRKEGYLKIIQNRNIGLKQNDVVNQYEMVLCHYEDKKKYIKSIKYGDLLLKGLQLSQARQSRTQVYELTRFSNINTHRKHNSILLRSFHGGI